MSIMMSRIESNGFDHGGGGCIFTVDPPPPSQAKSGRMATVVGGGSDREVCSRNSPSVSSDSSSIGRNSDDKGDEGGQSSPDDRDCGENEAESSYDEGSLEMMKSLEEVLPIRRGISEFYTGKSKSFTSLADTSSSTASAKDISKPDNRYSRRRRNLLSHHLWENTNRTSSHTGGISKKSITMSSTKSSLALAMAAASAMAGPGDDTLSSGSPLAMAGRTLPPLHPLSKGYYARGGGLCAWKSYSVVDLRRYFPAMAGGSGDSSYDDRNS